MKKTNHQIIKAAAGLGRPVPGVWVYNFHA